MYFIIYFRMWDKTCRVKYVFVKSKYDLFAYIGFYKCTEIERIDYIAYEEREVLGQLYFDARLVVERYLNSKI